MGILNDLPDKREQRARLDRLDTEPDILTALAERVANGVPLVDVAHDYGVSLRRLGKWLEDTEHPERLKELEFARRCYADKLATETVAISDEQALAYSKQGTPYDPDVARDTLRVSTRFKAAAKLDRARWGEKEQGALAGGVTVNLIQFSEAQILAGAPGRVFDAVQVALPQKPYADEELL